MFEQLILVYPKKLRQRFINELEYAGIHADHEKRLGQAIFLILIIAPIISLVLSYFTNFRLFILFFIGLIILFNVLFYWILLIHNDNRAKAAEEVLPDFLDSFSVHLMSSESVQDALFNSARREFGLLKDEINILRNKVELGASFEDAISEMGNTIKSGQLKASMRLLSNGIRTGGKVNELAKSIASSLRDKEGMNKKIISEVKGVVYFIILAVIIGAGLYAMSGVFVKIITDIFSKFDFSAISMIDTKNVRLSITPEFMFRFGIFAVISRCIMGAMTAALVLEDREIKGIKYLVWLIPAALAVFLIGRFVILYLLEGVI